MMLTAAHSAIYEAQIIAPTITATTNNEPLNNITLLLVEDNATNQLVASELLAAQGATVDIASSGEQALAMLAQQPARYNLVLMDIQMPDMDGYQTTQLIRQQYQFNNLPIIAMTANALPSDKAACLAAGMQDHIAKPFSLDEVVAKTLSYCQHADNSTLRGISSAFSPQILDFCQQQDIALEQAFARLDHCAALYIKVLHQFVADLQHCAKQLRQENISVKTAVVLLHSLKGASSAAGFTTTTHLAATQEQQLIDIDHFKLYNDQLGHLAGDDALRRVAKAMSDCCLRPNDLVARYGGEEFVVVLPDTDNQGAVVIAEKILATINELKIPHPTAPLGLISISIGIAMATPHTGYATDITERADQQMYFTKKRGRNGFTIESI